jgi:uncharacterized membrane protein YozB (DUF420 family)
MNFDGHVLPHVNASLNALATLLLITGFVLIQQGREQAHKWTMIACFGVSIAFLACYLTYHIGVRAGESTRFPTYPPVAIRYTYYVILVSHIVLAASVPFLAIVTIWTGLRCEHRVEGRTRHRRLAWWTFPIWLYVSITGVIVYLFIYWLYPPN